MSSSPSSSSLTLQQAVSTSIGRERVPAFDLFVIGTGGGPNETNLSGYLLKAHENSWSDGIVGVEAGSGLGALKNLLEKKSKNPFASTANEPGPSAAEIYSYIRTYLISHAHLDHVLSLVLVAGSFSGPRKYIRGSRECLEDLQSIFKPSRIWPNLASWNPEDADHLYLYDPIPSAVDQAHGKSEKTAQNESRLIQESSIELYKPLHGPLSVYMLPISHGPSYGSSAFFVRHNKLNREFLFFGDVEPDALAETPRISAVWQAAAPKIVSGVLSAIFIECSWPTGRPVEKIYGHMTPEYLVGELQVLASFVAKRRKLSSNNPSESSSNSVLSSVTSRKRASSSASPERKRIKHAEDEHSPKEEEECGLISLQNALSGLNVYIIHCKEDLSGEYSPKPIHQVISSQVRDLVNKSDLGAEVIAVEQGSLIHI